MRLDSKNLLIGLLVMFNVALMALVYKVNALVVDRIPARIEPHVYVMDLTEAVERQMQATTDLSYTVSWLKRHLNNCLWMIESERGLEPIPLNRSGEYALLPGENVYPEKKEPFLSEYKKPAPSSDKPEQEKNLRTLTCLVNLTTLSAAMSMYHTEIEIDNFYKRLQRIAPESHLDSANGNNID